jgi:hypothetical protein
MKKLMVVFFLLCITKMYSQYTIFQENFDLSPDFNTNGWITFNMSNPPGSVDWAQGTGSDIGEGAYNGGTTTYIASSYLATTMGGTISDWLISPVITFNNGDTVSFYTLSFNSFYFHDRVECRLSTNGAGTDLGSDENSVGDFTINLITVNPLLDSVGYPSHQNLSNTWTKFYGVVSGLSGATAGRIAFRYWVPNAGPGGTNSSTVGIDAVRVSSAFGLGLETELSSLVNIFPNPSANFVNIVLSSPIDGTISIYDLNGKTVLVQNLNTMNATIDISSLSKGSYLLKIMENGTGRFSMKTIVKN